MIPPIKSLPSLNNQSQKRLLTWLTSLAKVSQNISIETYSGHIALLIESGEWTGAIDQFAHLVLPDNEEGAEISSNYYDENFERFVREGKVFNLTLGLFDDGEHHAEFWFEFFTENKVVINFVHDSLEPETVTKIASHFSWDHTSPETHTWQSAYERLHGIAKKLEEMIPEFTAIIDQEDQG